MMRSRPLVLISLLFFVQGANSGERLKIAADTFARATGQADLKDYILRDLELVRKDLEPDSKTGWQKRLIAKGTLNLKSPTLDDELDDIAIALWIKFRGPHPSEKEPRIVFTAGFKDEPKFLAEKVSHEVDNVIQYAITVNPEIADLYINSIVQAKPPKGKSYRGATVDTTLKLSAKAAGFKDFAEDWKLEPAKAAQKAIVMEK